MRVVLIIICFFIFIPITYANESNVQFKIDKAVDVVKQLCLSGTEYELFADVNGDITIRKGHAGGKVTLKADTMNGANVISNENLRIIADDKIRECTQKELPKIINEILNINDVDSEFKIINKNDDIKVNNELILGDTYNFGSAHSSSSYDFKFHVNQPSISTFTLDLFSSTVILMIKNENGDVIAQDYFSTMMKGKSAIESMNKKLSGILFLPNIKYTASVKMKNKNESSSFKVLISTRKAN